jgi:putative sterol carrier protein
MAEVFPSAEWAAKYMEAINANAAYRVAGKDWTHGVIALVVKADDTLGIQEDTGIWLDVHQGSCRDCHLVSGEEAKKAPFVLLADYARWKQVIHGELEPIKGMMQGKLKLTKGQLPIIVKYVAAAKELVQSTTSVATKFLDE